jgi:transcriptional regulator with XRE-family HTH domain
MILSELGERIKTLRKERKLSQEELAKRAGISRNTLSKLENGYIANISIVTFEKVLNILGYRIDIKHNNPFIN